MIPSVSRPRGRGWARLQLPGEISPPSKSQTTNPTGLDAYAPAQMAARVEEAGVGKAHLSALSTLMLAMLAGAFIAFGAMFYTFIISNVDLSFGSGRLVGGVAFSLGLILVIVGGGELFTGNALIVMARASRRISTTSLLRNWALTFIGNFAGALIMVILVYLSGILSRDGGAVGEAAKLIAQGKLSLPVGEAFFRGVLCNALVCLAVWLCFAARDVAGKILVIVWPISAFVALGFEHSVANMFLIPVGMIAGAGFDLGGLLRNLLWVSLGNIAGGAGGVALVYWTIYLRPKNEM